MSVDLRSHGQVAHRLHDFQRAHLVGDVRLLVNRIGWAEKTRFYAKFAGEQSLGKVQFNFQHAVRELNDGGMGEGVVGDDVPLVINTKREPRILLRLRSDEKKCRWRILLLEDVQYLWSRCGVRTVIEAEGNFSHLRAELTQLIGLRQDGHLLRDD